MAHFAIVYMQQMNGYMSSVLHFSIFRLSFPLFSSPSVPNIPLLWSTLIRLTSIFLAQNDSLNSRWINTFMSSETTQKEYPPYFPLHCLHCLLHHRWEGVIHLALKSLIKTLPPVMRFLQVCQKSQAWV